MFYPVFFDNTIALVRNDTPSEENYRTAVYLSDGRVTYSEFTPTTLRKRYNILFNNERGF